MVIFVTIKYLQSNKGGDTIECFRFFFGHEKRRKNPTCIEYNRMYKIKIGHFYHYNHHHRRDYLFAVNEFDSHSMASSRPSPLMADVLNI